MLEYILNKNETRDKILDWVGLKRVVTREIEVVFLFTTAQQINKVNVYFWDVSTVTTTITLATNRTRISNTTTHTTSTYQSYYTNMTSSAPPLCAAVTYYCQLYPAVC